MATDGIYPITMNGGLGVKRVTLTDLNQRIGDYRVNGPIGGFDLTLNGFVLAWTGLLAEPEVVDINRDWKINRCANEKLAREGISKVQSYIREMYGTERKDATSLELEIDDVSVISDIVRGESVAFRASGNDGTASIFLRDCDIFDSPRDLLGKRVKITIENSPCAGPDKKLSSGHEQSNSSSSNGLIVPRVRLQR